MRDITQTDAARSRESQAYKGASTLVKCITEIIINSYESYKRLLKKGDTDNIEQSVLIITNSQEESIEVIDHFEGIAETEDEADEILAKKSRKQVTHTEESRSAMGRGMSDVLFRRSENVSILAWRRNKKTHVYKCQYVQSKKFQGEQDTEFINQEGKDPFIFQKIEKLIPNNGTYVKFFWKEGVEEEVFPSKDKIKEMLGHYFELKNLLNEQNFTVYLEFINKDGSRVKEPIRFVSYDMEEVMTLADQKLDIQIPERLQKICSRCGHENIKHTKIKCESCPCKLFQKKEYDIKILSASLYKSKTRLNVDKDEMRTQGLYIEGEHKQVYTMEFFGLEDKYPVEAPFYFGTVILSKDAKNYMMDMYNIMRIEILSQTRTGFEKSTKNQLYHKMRLLLKPWLESALKSESRISMEPTDTSARKGIEKLNEIMKEISEIEDAKGTGKSGEVGKSTRIPEFAEFEFKSYQIIENKPQRIKLLVNPKEFREGAKIEWYTTDQNLEIIAKIKQIPSKEEEVIKIPVIIKSSVLGDLGELFVILKKKDGQVLEPPPRVLIECIEEKDSEFFIPHETIEFNPKTVKVRILQSKSIDLYTHGNIITPGTDIVIWFEPEHAHSRLEPIDITNPTNVQITAPEYKFNFKISNSELIQESGNYRKTIITFAGRQPDLNGVIKAKTVIDSIEHIAMCSISFISDDDGKGGGYFQHWKGERISGNDRAWIYENGIAIANLALPHVSRVLGSNDVIAKNRFELYEESKLFVANGITSLAFEEAIINDFEGHNKNLEKQGVSSIDKYKHLMSQKNQWESLFADAIFEAFEVKPRTQVPEGLIQKNKITVLFPFDFKEFHIQSYYAGQKEIHNALFKDSDLINVKKRHDYVVKCMNEKITIGVYEFENGIGVRFDSFDWNGEMQEILLQLRDTFQVYKKPEIIPEGIPENYFFSPVLINIFQNNKLTQIPITLENVLKIPDSPRSLGKEMPYEDDNTWIYENNRMILYKLYNDVQSHKISENSGGQLICFIDSKNFYYMALNFLRLRIIRPLATHYYLSETVLPNTKAAKCKKCGLTANGQLSVKNSFGFFYDDKNAGISKLCLEHSN